MQSDDQNGDGYIDIGEAETVLGKVLIPMDADISSQNSGKSFYPVGDLSGSYHYERITSFKRFFNDLRSEDTIPDDNVVKLDPNKGFEIEGKVVMVQGVSQETEFPDTVAGSGRYLPFQTLPIACGVFRKSNEVPGTPYTEEIPDPIAEVEEGQDRPSPEETPPTGDTDGPRPSGGGSNDSDTETETSDENGNRRTSGETTTDTEAPEET